MTFSFAGYRADEDIYNPLTIAPKEITFFIPNSKCIYRHSDLKFCSRNAIHMSLCILLTSIISRNQNQGIFPDCGSKRKGLFLKLIVHCIVSFVQLFYHKLHPKNPARLTCDQACFLSETCFPSCLLLIQTQKKECLIAGQARWVRCRRWLVYNICAFVSFVDETGQVDSLTGVQNLAAEPKNEEKPSLRQPIKESSNKHSAAAQQTSSPSVKRNKRYYWINKIKLLFYWNCRSCIVTF